MEILGIRFDHLDEPIIDVGCGSEAHLVRALRNSGKNVVGIERNCPADFAHIVARDWFDFDFLEHQWGTIISHMAFSNHYRHAISLGGDIVARFAAKYREMMSSPSPGGSFLYAPSIPEIEATIDVMMFQITTRTLPGGYAATRITRRA
jgi:hypothetical protein